MCLSLNEHGVVVLCEIEREVGALCDKSYRQASQLRLEFPLPLHRIYYAVCKCQANSDASFGNPINKRRRRGLTVPFHLEPSLLNDCHVVWVPLHSPLFSRHPWMDCAAHPRLRGWPRKRGSRNNTSFLAKTTSQVLSCGKGTVPLDLLAILPEPSTMDKQAKCY